MFDFIRANQLDMMLCLSGICFTMGILLFLTKSLEKRRKWILIIMEVIATLLLMNDRNAYIYAGDTSTKGYYMVRISNFMVFFLTSMIVMAFNAVLMDQLATTGKMTVLPRRLIVSGLIGAFGMLMAVISAFTNLYYYFDTTNRYHRGPGFLISYIWPIVGPMIQYTVIRQYKDKFSKLIYTALVLYLFVPIVCGIIQIFEYGISIVNMAMVLVSIFLYVFTYLDVNEAIERAHEIETRQLVADRQSMKRLFDQTATAFVSAMEIKDAYPPGHSERAASAAVKIAKAMGKDENEVDDIYYAALLHNVGVIGIPDGILENADKLSAEQMEVLKKTPLISADILSCIKEFPFLEIAGKYCYEKYDGSGYPEGLKGEEIPEIARIMAVVDAYDSMTTKSKFSDPLPYPIVREEFILQAGHTLDPQMAEIMVEVLDEEIKQIGEENLGKNEGIESELICKAYRGKMSTGVLVDDKITTISFISGPLRTDSKDFSAPSIIIFDSYDRKVHATKKTIDDYRYMEYGEAWFDGNYISTEARRMEVNKLSDDGLLPADGSGRYTIKTFKNGDHIRVILRHEDTGIDVIMALPDNSKYAAVAITGENCIISDITVTKRDPEVCENIIPRIAEEVNYIDRLESDLPNVQVDKHRSAYSEAVEISDGLRLAFHNVSLPSANLVWHCPFILIFYSEDGKVDGKGFKEYSLIKLNGEIDKNDVYAGNSFSMKRDDTFPGWNSWKEVNKSGLDYMVRFTKKGNVITMETNNLGVSIKNTTTIRDGSDKAYVAVTGDMVALTDIRVM